MQEKIEFHKARDLGEKINATFAFVSQNFMPLFKSILFIVGPAILVAGFLYTKLITGYTNMIRNSSSGETLGSDQLGLASEIVGYSLAIMGFAVISGTLIISVVYSYIMLYKENETPAIEVGDVWNRVKKVMFGILGTLILVYLIAVAAALVSFIFIVPGAVSQSPVLIFVGVILMFCGIFYFSVTCSLSFITYMDEGSIRRAISRSFTLIKGKWWSTFGLLFVVSFLQSVMAFVFAIPMYMVMAFNMAATTQDTTAVVSPAMEVLNIATTTFYFAGAFMLYSLPLVAIAFQYYNLKEMKEATGLLDRIETMGESKSTNEEESY